MDKSAEGVPMGHKFLGVVEETGSQVRGLKRGDFVVSPFAFADNTCAICRDGFHTACPNGGWYGGDQRSSEPEDLTELLRAATGADRPTENPFF
ncbi:alcohol dehydrogenase catalytic domain-containing protein [[Kitasatospora] papulosa]|uniref:alcohol dehydrogenase catalytic domain-containing protein n=1 Tax=[Kitasatospora] papulosa TaxID=1464011 RepID=UPI0037FBEEA0